jgi:hypothetical protein
MKRNNCARAGLTVVEMLTATLITTIILGSVAAASIALQKSFLGNKALTKSNADTSRIIDYISQDLRNATAVSRRTNNTATAFRLGDFEISDTDQLCVVVPDYYVSNIPDNGSGSPYKTPRFARANIPTGRTYYIYDDIVAIDGSTRIAKYPSTVEVRYLKQTRASDNVVCFYRQEYEGATLRKTEEVAEKVAAERIRVVAVGLYDFQISATYNSLWSKEKYRESTRQFSTVHLPNYRTDWR